MCKQIAYEIDEPYVRVLVLVVNEDFRRKGVGQKLIFAAENWAKENDCVAVTFK